MDQKEFDEIFDMKAENKPQKTVSKKTKQNLITLGCIALGIILAFTVISIFKPADKGGASDPMTAVTENLKAGLLYDAEGMVKYSSMYNKLKLSSGSEYTNDSSLISYLEKQYNGRTPKYNPEDIYTEGYAREYEKGSGNYEKILAKYELSDKEADKILESSKSKIDKVAMVYLTLYNGVTQNPREKCYIAVQENGKWYYAFAWVEE